MFRSLVRYSALKSMDSSTQRGRWSPIWKVRQVLR
jgi:hypothetical protein